MILDSTKEEIVIQPVHSYFNDIFQFCTLQIPLQKDDINNYINGLSDKDLLQCSQHQLSIITTGNVEKYEWQLIDGTTSTEQTILFTANTYKNETCGILKLNLEKFGGIKINFCHVYFSQPYINTENTLAKIQNESSIKSTSLENITASKYDGMHFSSGSVPIAPKRDSGAYVMIQEPVEEGVGSITILEIDNESNILNTFKTGDKGRPYDIVSTKYGFVYMARNEPHYLYVTAYDTTKKTQKWKVNLINNGKDPSTATDQVNLGDSFGTTVMFNPHNGRLQNARERIFAVFAHYNYFGLYDNGERNVHTGDSSIFLDLETGQQTGYSFTWSSSHSLKQYLHYDGKIIFTAALGDAYPQSIKNHAIQGFQGQHEDISDIGDQVIEPDFIPGNGGGKAAGRLGGILEIGENQYIQIHAQRPATSTFGNGGTSTVDKLAITLLQQGFRVLKRNYIKKWKFSQYYKVSNLWKPYNNRIYYSSRSWLSVFTSFYKRHRCYEHFVG